MMPLRGLALASLEADLLLFKQSFNTLVVGSFIAIMIAWLLGRIFYLPASEFGSEIIARTQPNLTDLGVAIAAGAVSSFAKIRPKISDILAGTAISVALMPPLCVVGLALSQADWTGSGGAFLLYFTNLLGIILAGIIVFIWGGYYLDYGQIKRALVWVLTLTGILVIPLFISLVILIKQKELQSTIKQILRTETITVGQQTELVKMDVKWNLVPWINQPSTVILTVRTNKPITPKQVNEVEKFLQVRLRQPFKLVFLVAEYREVKADDLETN
jgi:uncharacterized hydrophobic protein (TIGR00271 family)